MRKLDSFFDTYEKRKYFVYGVILACCIVFSIVHIYLGMDLLTLKTYDEVLSFVDKAYIQSVYFGRNALELLNIQVLNVLDYLKNLFKLKIFEVIYFIGNVLCLFTKKKNIAYLHLLSFIFIYLFIIIMFLLAIHSGSLYQVISYLHIIGIEIVIVYVISLIIQIKEMIQTIKNYKESLKVEVIIVND